MQAFFWNPGKRKRIAIQRDRRTHPGRTSVPIERRVEQEADGSWFYTGKQGFELVSYRRPCADRVIQRKVWPEPGPGARHGPDRANFIPAKSIFGDNFNEASGQRTGSAYAMRRSLRSRRAKDGKWQ